MKLSIPYWQNRISPVFDVSNSLCLIEIDSGREVKRENIVLTRPDPFGRAQELSNLGIDVLLCGAVSQVLETALICSGIRVISFICGDMEEVICAFLHGQISDKRFLMPGCCEKHHRKCSHNINRQRKHDKNHHAHRG
ncbi:MAG: hypothetical protein HQK77_15590 [Desulfobacterales bacterium]|nr:hypothetical protein [Desulfobacterales bacterium]